MRDDYQQFSLLCFPQTVQNSTLNRPNRSGKTNHSKASEIINQSITFKIFPLFCVCNEIYCASCWLVEWVYRESIEPPVFGWLGPTSREDGATISYIIYICNQLTGRKKERFNNYAWMSLLLDPPMMRGNDPWGWRLFIFLLQLIGCFGRKDDLIARVKI